MSQNLRYFAAANFCVAWFFGGGLGGNVQKSPSSICTKLAIVVEGFNINLWRCLLFPFDSLRGNYCLACVKSIL